MTGPAKVSSQAMTALTAAGRARREKVRLQAAAMFEQGMPPVQVACRLRVSTKSA